MQKQYRTVETSNGIGKVYSKDDQFLAKVFYNLNVQQEMINIAGQEEIPGRKRISAQIKIIEGKSNLANRESLTLHLADNRRWSFFAQGNPISGYTAVNASTEGLVLA